MSHMREWAIIRIENSTDDPVVVMDGLGQLVASVPPRRDRDISFSGTGPISIRYSQPGPSLTDAQCDEFRRLPCSFNEMVRAIYRAGHCFAAAAAGTSLFIGDDAVTRALAAAGVESSPEARQKMRKALEAAFTRGTEGQPSD